MDNKSFNALVEHYLGASLPDYLVYQVSLSGLPAEAQRFIIRMLTLMKRACYPATEFTPLLMRAIAFFIPEALPSAGKSRIPPITMPGRHQKLDRYVAKHTRKTAGEHPVFIDVGCGFPPVTTVETATNLPDWILFGVDRFFASYILYDPDGHYACFGHNGEYQYYQAQMNANGRVLNDHPQSAKTHFEKLFAHLFPLISVSKAPISTTVEKDGSRLIHDHIRDFETDHLSFVEAPIEELELPAARVIRCMNVLLYFDLPVRKTMLSSMGELLDDDGILVAGFNHILGSSARYRVYHKTFGGISLHQFAFSLDNLRPMSVAPWYTIHSDDSDALLLADLTATIRDDQYFWPTFSRRVDQLLEQHEVCRRGEEGFLLFPEKALPPDKLIGKMAAVWGRIAAEGYTAGAVEALRRAGHQAWENIVGDIAFKPAPGTCPTV